MAFSGIPCGLMISQPLIGALTQTYGWDIQFYIIGSLCCLYFPVWMWYVRDEPSQMESWKISQDELEFLSQFKIKRSKHTVPWKNILISLPIWGLITSWFSANYLFVALVSVLPTYLSNVHGQDILASGGLASLPHLSIFICSFIQAALASYLKRKFKGHLIKLFFQRVHYSNYLTTFISINFNLCTCDTFTINNTSRMQHSRSCHYHLHCVFLPWFCLWWCTESKCDWFITASCRDIDGFLLWNFELGRLCRSSR